MSHLTRAATLLVLVAAGFGLMRCATEQLTVPAIGLVRNDNAAHWASLEPRLGNPAQCSRCHDAIDMMWSRSAHAGQTCEACHSAGDRHIAYGAILPPMRELCTTCHENVTGKPDGFSVIDRVEHYPLQDCVSCHDPHSPAAAFPDIPHNVAGREDCLACHGVAAIASLPPNHLERPVELCLGCHKRGEGEPR